MKIGIVVYSNDSETVWNAFRFGNYAMNEGDSVQVFLLGKGVQSESLDTDTFQITEQMRSFVQQGGAIAACETCLKIHHLGGSELCPISTLADLHTLVKESDTVVTF
jgi:sulfur relay (sulfurtransferase) complex TusBCD TusD component (DsrE family)